jgi:GGDEF domain-containing protein
VFVLENLAGCEDALAVAQRMFREVGSTIAQGEKIIHVSISIGICTFPDRGDDPDTLIHQADLALLHAKTLPGEKTAFYSETQNILLSPEMVSPACTVAGFRPESQPS